MDDPLRRAVCLSDPGEVAAALPSLLGFAPHESVVVVALGGPGGSRVGLTVRADLPAGHASAALARALARSLATDDPSGALVLVVTEAPDDGADPGLPHRGVVHDLVVALSALDVPVREALLVRAGRWWSYDCPHPCCAPGGGTPLPAGTTELAAAAVAGGRVVERDREALGRRLRPPGPAAAAAEAACLRVAGRRRALRARAGAAALAARDRTAIRTAVARCRPGAGTAGVRLPDEEVATVVWALCDVLVRDWALHLALGEDAAAAEALWTECVRRAPSPLDAAPATLLAVGAWLRGDGAMANVALEHALDSDPGYALAALLAQGLAACLPPADLRAMIETTVADLGPLDQQPTG